MNFNQSIAAAQTPISASLGTAAGEATAHSPVANADASTDNPPVSAAALTPEAAISNIQRANSAETLKLAAEIASSVIISAPDKLAASGAYRKRLAELKAEIDKGAT